MRVTDDTLIRDASKEMISPARALPSAEVASKLTNHSSAGRRGDWCAVRPGIFWKVMRLVDSARSLCQRAFSRKIEYRRPVAAFTP